MPLVLLILLTAVALFIAYLLYGNFVSKKLGVNLEEKAPSHQFEDGVDYVPTRPVVVLGHHFASIAGAGPIVGPVIALTFGWIPAVIWIIVGGIFFGAVHDLGSLMASLKHEGKGIGYIIKLYIGLRGKRLFLLFSFATLILIIAVFADIIAKTFVGNPAVAGSSILFVFLAVLFGKANTQFGGKRSAFILLSVVGVLLTYAAVPLGAIFTVDIAYDYWIYILLIYAFVSAVAPVHVLLQPRDYLNSYLLYGLMLAAVLGILIAQPQIEMTNEIFPESESLGYMFPVLFVTIACGAISGFHSLVASGTTSKQLDQLKHAKPIAFGGMLIESFLAILAVGAVAVLSREDYTARLIAESPVPLFADGLGGIITALGIPQQVAVSFVALTVSAFAITTLDTCTRLARFAFQELFEEVNIPKLRTITDNRFAGTLLIILLSFFLLGSGGFGVLWPIFGSANQLLAAIALLAVGSWLLNEGKNTAFVLIPMVFMFVVTLSSLLLFAYHNWGNGRHGLGLLALLLAALAIVLIVLAAKGLRKGKPGIKDIRQL